jgi:hypothetical protein
VSDFEREQEAISRKKLRRANKNAMSRQKQRQEHEDEEGKL